MNSPRTEVQFSKKQQKTMLFGLLYGAKDGWIAPPGSKPEKTTAELANERWHTAEHIRVTKQPTSIGRTHEHLTDDGDPDVYGMLTEFLFSRGAIQRIGEPEFYPTYVVIADGRLIPYDLENPGKPQEELLVWI